MKKSVDTQRAPAIVSLTFNEVQPCRYLKLGLLVAPLSASSPALSTVERAKGYIEATEDAKPPRMVEEPRAKHGVFSRDYPRPATSQKWWFER